MLRILLCQKIHLSLCCIKKQAKILNNTAKIQIKSEKLTPFGKIFQIMEQFNII